MVSNLFKAFGENFNGVAAAKNWAGRKATPYLGEFLDKIGDDNLIAIIKAKAFITDGMTEEYREYLKKLCSPYIRMLPGVTNWEVYNWIPEKNRKAIESVPDGRQWAFAQLKYIREYLMS